MAPDKENADKKIFADEFMVKAGRTIVQLTDIQKIM
jgi:hypothetical protein